MLYKNPTVAALAELVAERLAGGGAEEPPPLRSRFEGGGAADAAAVPVPAVTFNVNCMVRGPAPIQRYQTVSMAVWLEGALDVPALKASLRLVHDRHEALRLHYATDPATGQRSMVVAPVEGFALPLREVDLVELGPEAAEKKAQQLYAFDACHEQLDPFNEHATAGFGPLSHFHLVKVSAVKAFFFYGIHHAVFDGHSSR